MDYHFIGEKKMRREKKTTNVEANAWNIYIIRTDKKYKSIRSFAAKKKTVNNQHGSFIEPAK